ncbi:hypothetical protein NliqN6_2783 [Naganishia liquefaciens]|uniref:Uncharacterized protein n=1 Tax=Naganishia liquefaciens TaxID=104408 RepID=A0A8H3YG50_9TREE|nr:hypothetical protein NliqN6_2783 [Naganishia liquefaciens]
MSLPHTPITRTPWHDHQLSQPAPSPASHEPRIAYGLAGMPPDFPLPQPPTGPTSLASPFHPGTTFRSSRVRKNKEGDRFHDVRQLFARRELERQNTVAAHGRKRCFCENELEDEEDIYCSSACARMDAMSSLCFAETRPLHTAESSISSLSSVSTSLTSSTTPRPISDAQQIPLSPSQASHYRRITSDLVKRRAANGRTGTASSRRRPRDPTAQASISSIASTSIHRVPSLVGGDPMVTSSSSATSTTHSRTASDESGRSSLRWPSVSDRGIVLAEVGQAGLGNVKEEKEDDVERLADAEEEEDQENVGFVPINPRDSTAFRPRRGSLSFATLNRALSHPETAFGMGKDMQDVLDEIIMMEQGFDIQTSESEHDDDVAARSRPVTPPVRGSMGLPPAPRRSAHYLDDPGHAASMGPLRTSRHLPTRSEPSFETYVPPAHIMSQLPSAFEDAEDDLTTAIQPDGPPLVEGRRSFTRRSRSEIRRSLSFVPPTGYRASLLASLQDPAPRASVHPYRRPAVTTTMTVDDSVTRFQFPKMPPPLQTGSVIRTTIAESQEMEVVVSPPPPPPPPPTTDGALSNDYTAGALAPALFPASPAEADSVDPETAVPTSGLRLGVLLGSGVDEDEDAWFRSRRAGEEGAMDVETP